ncbi:GerW family sporulation protein [Rubeoparvulum massiliense]|uniref:GerW family sporulation protein n=1 Tax=Rubeoparvulum massiliense TaxID=1631346 RepID=UPI00065E7943|nr:GerW family sporulation protein [Rubeoparvulum massiliense]
MAEHPIQGLMKEAMENIKEMVDVNTIIGDPVEADGSFIIPVSKVGFGFAAGGSQFQTRHGSNGQGENAQLPFGGGAGGGVSITPVAFLVISPEEIRSISLETPNQLYETLLDRAPKLLEQLQRMFTSEPKDEMKNGRDDSSRSSDQ